MSGRNSAYSPLPQSNSDSDGSSEEELSISQDYTIVNRTFKNQLQKTEKTLNEPKNNILSFKPLETDGNVGVTLLTFQSCANEISILKPKNSSEVFSISRKICFAFSLLLCIFTTIIFIWVLPCNVGTCLSSSNNIIKSWEKILPGLELYGPISLVPDYYSKKQDLVFLLKSSRRTNIQNRVVFEGGIISLNGISGAVIWQTKLNTQPTDIDCKLIDANIDGLNDCLLYGQKMLKAINPSSGTELWDIFNANKKFKISILDFPLKIPDLNGDKVNELVTSCSFTKNNEPSSSNSNIQNYIIIISGKTGQIINIPVQIKLCSAIHNLLLENNSVISYTCYNSYQKESMQTVYLKDLYKTNINVSLDKYNIEEFRKIYQHKDLSSFYLKGCRLILENHGHCPQDCSVLVEVKSEKEGRNYTIYSYKETNAYGMTPVVMNSGTLNAFVLKFWKWYSKQEKLNLQNNIASLKQKKKITNNYSKGTTNEKEKLKKIETLANEMLLESDSNFQRFKRSLNSQDDFEIEKEVNHLNLHLIRETIVLITFNQNKTFVNNITENEIIQICRAPQSICEPDANEQKHSMIAVNINEDEREELISYTSTYINTKREKRFNKENWQLQSTVHVINL